MRSHNLNERFYTQHGWLRGLTIIQISIKLKEEKRNRSKTTSVAIRSQRQADR